MTLHIGIYTYICQARKNRRSSTPTIIFDYDNEVIEKGTQSLLCPLGCFNVLC